MNTITIAQLSNGFFVMKGRVFDTLDTASALARCDYGSAEQIVRDATTEENAFWLESLKNEKASVIVGSETTMTASMNSRK